MTTIDNSHDVIDSRDVIARIEDLHEERQTLADELGDIEEQIGDLDEDASEFAREDLDEECAAAFAALQEWQRDNGEDLRILEALVDEAEYSPDWKYGGTLIRRSYFETYAKELAEDCGMLENANNWPLTCIDWNKAARELEQDYMSVDFDGVEYLIRA